MWEAGHAVKVLGRRWDAINNEREWKEIVGDVETRECAVHAIIMQKYSNNAQKYFEVLEMFRNAQDVYKRSDMIPINVQNVHNATACSSMIKYAEVARSMLKYDQVCWSMLKHT